MAMVNKRFDIMMMMMKDDRSSFIIMHDLSIEINKRKMDSPVSGIKSGGSVESTSMSGTEWVPSPCLGKIIMTIVTFIVNNISFNIVFPRLR